jgi:hypothetical protein
VAALGRVDRNLANWPFGARSLAGGIGISEGLGGGQQGGFRHTQPFRISFVLAGLCVGRVRDSFVAMQRLWCEISRSAGEILHCTIRRRGMLFLQNPENFLENCWIFYRFFAVGERYFFLARGLTRCHIIAVRYRGLPLRPTVALPGRFLPELGRSSPGAAIFLFGGEAGGLGRRERRQVA